MTVLDYDLDEDDLLSLQLYFASIDERAIKQRKKEKCRMLGLSVLCGVMLFLEDGYRTYSYFFLGASFLFFIVYPWWSTWFYKRMYRRQVVSFFRGKFPYRMKVVLYDDYMDIETPKGCNRTNIYNVKSIIETGDSFFVVTNNTGSIVIPKKKVENVKEIEELLKGYTVNFVKNLNWKWS